MHVVGGYYLELCRHPEAQENFGSGGRAALALAETENQVEWHYYCPQHIQKDAQVILSNPNLSHNPHHSQDLVSFRYLHPLSDPIFSPEHIQRNSPLTVTGENILRFGFMEGDAIVHGDHVVYDPQSPKHPLSFRENGSTAEHLALVLNSYEASKLGRNKNEDAAIKTIFNEQEPDVIVVKSGAAGCRIYEKDQLVATVPAYNTDRVYKIGSGDIFSAAFFYNWATKSTNPTEAADIASRCTASYCDTRNLAVDLQEDLQEYKPVTLSKPEAQIYPRGPILYNGRTMAD